MNCEACLERILEGDLELLRAGGDPTLAGHLAACPRCRAAAERVMAREEEMRAVWRAARPARAVGVRGVRRRRRAAWLMPIAAAAAFAGVLTLRWDKVAAHFGPSSVERSAAAARLLYPPPTVPNAPVVNAAPGGGVAVLRTNDPSITLILNF